MGKEQEHDLAEMAFEHLVGCLLDGTIQPGAKLSQRELAEELGISSQPVGVALKRLEYEGIIKFRPRSGGYVSHFSEEEFWDAIQERVALEQRAAQLACRYASNEELLMLKPLAESADRTVEIPVHLGNDFRFHRELFACAHSPRLYAAVSDIRLFRIKLMLCPSLLPHGIEGPESLLYGHCALLEAVLSRNEMKAIIAAEQHIYPPRLRAFSHSPFPRTNVEE